MFLISWISQENIYVGAYFSKVAGLNIHFEEHLRTTASVFIANHNMFTLTVACTIIRKKTKLKNSDISKIVDDNRTSTIMKNQIVDSIKLSNIDESVTFFSMRSSSWALSLSFHSLTIRLLPVLLEWS